MHYAAIHADTRHIIYFFHVINVHNLLTVFNLMLLYRIGIKLIRMLDVAL